MRQRLSGTADTCGGIPSNRVKEIAQALHEVDFAARLAALQMSDFAAAEIYPNIWDRPEEEDDIRAELQECFRRSAGIL